MAMLEKLRTRIRDFFLRIFRGEPQAPGYFVTGKKFSWHGRLAGLAWVWPSREYLVYVPRGYGGWRRRTLVVLLHGCKQTPEDFAAAIGIAALADRHGWLVLMPRQVGKANPYSCWNWFDTATSAGRGEAAIVSAQIRAVRRTYRVKPSRVFVAGFSAGGCLAAVLGLHHPEHFAGVFVHSGAACGAASGPMDALNVMKKGATTPYEEVARRARSAAARWALPLPLVVVHGARDSVVAEINGVQLARQFLVLNGRPLGEGPPSELPEPDNHATVTLPGGREVTTSDYREGVRVVRVAQLDHSWSGGDAAFPYNDPLPPAATDLLGEFVEGRLRIG
jgi:poly(hydroxyalkanoate) depolymerase family esterase